MDGMQGVWLHKSEAPAAYPHYHCYRHFLHASATRETNGPIAVFSTAWEARSSLGLGATIISALGFPATGKNEQERRED